MAWGLGFGVHKEPLERAAIKAALKGLCKEPPKELYKGLHTKGFHKSCKAVYEFHAGVARCLLQRFYKSFCKGYLYCAFGALIP